MRDRLDIHWHRGALAGLAAVIVLALGFGISARGDASDEADAVASPELSDAALDQLREAGAVGVPNAEEVIGVEAEPDTRSADQARASGAADAADSATPRQEERFEKALDQVAADEARVKALERQTERFERQTDRAAEAQTPSVDREPSS